MAGIVKRDPPSIPRKRKISKKFLDKDSAMGMPLRNPSKKKKVQRRVMQGNYNEFY